MHSGGYPPSGGQAQSCSFRLADATIQHVGGRNGAINLYMEPHLAGSLSQRHACPLDKKAYEDPLIARRQLFQNSGNRFFDRAGKCGRKNAASPRQESLKKSAGRWVTSRGSSRNVAIRSGAPRDGEIRACDDLRRPHANLACDVITPINLIS